MHHLLSKWAWKMAWRDSRASRRRLLLYMSAIVLGVAALVAIRSFGQNLSDAIDEQSRNLLGADLALSSSRTFPEAVEERIRDWGSSQSRQVSFSSMAYFPDSGGFRLVQVRALEGDFPYYGKLETVPPSAALSYQGGAFALVDDALLTQFRADVGSRIRLGESTFQVAGRLVNIPGESLVFSLAAPRVFIPLRYLEETGLIQVGSRVEFRRLLQWADSAELTRALEEAEPLFEENRIRSETVERRKRRLGRAMTNFGRFLSLVGFIALLLGAIGIASAIHHHVKQKTSTIAILRCLGCTSSQVFAVYLIQALALGFLGSTLGALLGIGVQYALPLILADFIPVRIPFSISVSALMQAVGIGIGTALLFALYPLAPVRLVSPLLALRKEFEEGKRSRDRVQILVLLAIAASILVFAVSQTEHWWVGVWFFVGLAAAIGLLAGFAKVIVLVARGAFPAGWSYVWRQGFANLYRPHNQTVLLMLSIGLGTFLIVTLYLVQDSLLAQAELTGSGDRPNLVLFDIQTHQKPGVAEILSTMNAPVLQDVPIVSMRLSSVEGRSVQELRQQEDRSSWALRREYRSTYRDHLEDSEKVVAGQWVGSYDPASGPIPISLEEEIARELGVGVGDQLVFDVQGREMAARVGSIREVEWERFQPNFFAVFPRGALEQAPQFHVLVTRVDSSQMSGEVQRRVIEAFPNVSAIDLELVLSTIDSILDRVAFVVRFMALFSIFTGFLVLAGAVVAGRFQRMKETVLLRTLGASRRQIIKIMLIEYFLLGTLAAMTGLSLSVVASWALAFFLFETSLVPALLPVLVAFVVVAGLTMAIGTANSWTVIDRPPLEVLRQEGG